MNSRHSLGSTISPVHNSPTLQAKYSNSLNASPPNSQTFEALGTFEECPICGAQFSFLQDLILHDCSGSCSLLCMDNVSSCNMDKDSNSNALQPTIYFGTIKSDLNTETLNEQLRTETKCLHTKTLNDNMHLLQKYLGSVSYTHLTLPTKA